MLAMYGQTPYGLDRVAAVGIATSALQRTADRFRSEKAVGPPM